MAILAIISTAFENAVSELKYIDRYCLNINHRYIGCCHYIEMQKCMVCSCLLGHISRSP